MTFWCTGGCRDKLYITPPITRWIYEIRYKYPWYLCNRQSYETSTPGINPGVHNYSYIQIRMARFLAPGLSLILHLLPFNLNLHLSCCDLFYLWTSTYTHRVFVFTLTHDHTHTRTCTRICICTRIRTHTFTLTHTHTRTRTTLTLANTNTHTHTHTHTHIE